MSNLVQNAFTQIFRFFNIQSVVNLKNFIIFKLDKLLHLRQ